MDLPWIPWIYHGFTMDLPWIYHGFTMDLPVKHGDLTSHRYIFFQVAASISRASQRVFSGLKPWGLNLWVIG